MNPRYPFEYAALAKRCFRPLSHLTGEPATIDHQQAVLFITGLQEEGKQFPRKIFLKEEDNLPHASPRVDEQSGNAGDSRGRSKMPMDTRGRREINRRAMGSPYSRRSTPITHWPDKSDRDEIQGQLARFLQKAEKAHDTDHADNSRSGSSPGRNEHSARWARVLGQRGPSFADQKRNTRRANADSRIPPDTPQSHHAIETPRGNEQADRS